MEKVMNRVTWCMVFILLLNFPTICTTAAATGSFLCFISKANLKTLRFTLVKNDDSFHNIYAQNKVDSCSLKKGQFTAVGSSVVLEVNVEDSTVMTNCGIVKGQAPNDQVYTLHIVTQQSETIEIASDKLYSMSCDFASITSVQEIPVAGVTITGTLVTGTIDKETFTVALAIIDKETGSTSENQTVTTVGIGKKVALRATLSASGTHPVGIRVIECSAVPSSGTGSYQLIDDKGCPVSSSLMTTGFSGRDTDGSSAESGTFTMFKFPQGNAVNFKCSATFCFEKADVACGQSHCQPFGRRRRSETTKSPHPHTSASLSTTVTVCYGALKECPTKQAPGPDTHLGTASQLVQCLQNRTLAAGSGVLLTLLVLTTSLAVIFFCLLIRRRDQSERSRKQPKIYDRNNAS